MELAAVLRERVLRVFKKTYSSNFRIIVYVGRSGVFFSVSVERNSCVLLVSYVMWSGASESLDLLLSHHIIALAYHISIILITTLFYK